MKKEKRILVVDDQPGVRRLICEALLDEGHLVEQATNGMEAVKKMAQKNYNVILLDIKMPGMSGLETLSEIQKINAGQPVIMMTAYGEMDILEELHQKGVGHISKPFDLDELRTMVSDVLNREAAAKTVVRTG